MPSPKSHEVAVARPSTMAVSCTARPMVALVKVAAMPPLNGPVSAPAGYSSQPMESGLAPASPARSVGVAGGALPAPRQGEPALRRQAVASCGSGEMLPTPLAGCGVVQQKFKVLYVS